MTPSCWIVTDGKAGMEVQCVGLAQKMGLEPVVKRVALRSPWKQLSPTFLRLGHEIAHKSNSDSLAPPWPDILIATGRHSIAASLLVRKYSPQTFRIQIQKPALAIRYFDLVVTPEHDRLSGNNVITTLGSLHNLTPSILTSAAAEFAPQVAHLPAPYVAVLLGGTNAYYTLDEVTMRKICDDLTCLATDFGVSLLVTPSRRTGARNEAILRTHLSSNWAQVWDGKSKNPYHAYLGLSQAIIVTPDSVNMVCEAASTGKPVYVIDLKGGSPKFERFHTSLRKAGITRVFDGCLSQWHYPALTESERVAQLALDRYRNLAKR